MKAEDTVKEKTGFLDNMLDILRQLLSGMLASLGIFVLTLIFSLPLGLVITFIRRSKLNG